MNKEHGVESKNATTVTLVAPARVNLIGEHTDYTGGLVLPMAIPFTTQATIGPASDGGYTFKTEMFDAERKMSVEDRGDGVGDWSDYPVGVLRQLQTLGIEIPPFVLHFKSNVPLGSGLSSSASVEVATCVALLQHAGQTLPAETIALLCQRAENEYVHSPCGIMDQFVVTAATEGHALLLHTRDLQFELLPMNQGGLGQCKVVVANSGVKHSIGGGEYGKRRKELEAGQALLVERFPGVRDLGEASLEQLEQVKPDISQESYLRCRHIISENGRVLQAREAMLAGDAVRLGAIMTAGHASERDDFAVSVEEVDFLVETAVALDGCHGARLTGGGFGGCTVNLVDGAKAEAFTAGLRAAYKQRYDIDAEVFVCDAVDGAMARWAQEKDGMR